MRVLSRVLLALTVSLTGCGGGLRASDGGAPTDATAPADGPAGCRPACSGATPVCNDHGHCVGCAADANCPSGSYCKITSDTLATCAPGCSDDARCPPGKKKCCAGRCVDLANDAANCGACGTACSSNHASSTCAAGACALGPCQGGWGDCNGDAKDGCEANLHVDPQNCTACKMKCAIPNAVNACADGCYEGACNFGFDDCNRDPMDGCETSVLKDAMNCGACGQKCVSPPNGAATCQAGTCFLTACNGGFADCNAVAKDGCEVNVLTDAKNCGGCGKACGPGNVCMGGACTCPNCNNAFANASAQCQNNQCIFDKCNLGYANCDNNVMNGCEVNLLSDGKNCARCGAVCPQNTPNCVNGVCGNVDLTGETMSFASEGRTVHIFKTPAQCVVLANYTDYCPKRGLAWWRPRSSMDAQTLIQNAYNIDMTHTWIQIYQLKTALGSVGGFPVMTDGGNCVEGSAHNWGAFRKWACSFCDPESDAMQMDNGQSCCWDKSHPYDWFVCEG